jgi:hypothetical protein
MRLLQEKIAEVQELLANINPRQWLFLEHLNRIEVCLDGVLTDWRIDRREHRSSADNTRCYQLYISKDGLSVAHYQVMRRLLPDSVMPTKSDEVGLAEIGFAYQVDGNDDESDARVANFFATDCLSPLPAIAVHGTFLLKADRSHLAEDDPSYQHALTDALCNLLRERLIPGLVAQCGPGALYYLAPHRSNSIGETYGVEAELQQRLVDEVKSTVFVRTIAGSDAAPRNLNLWGHGLGKLLETSPAGPEITRLPHPHWCNDDTRTILCNLGAHYLTPTEHVKAMQGWQPTSPEAACDAHDTLAQTYREISWPRYDGKEAEREKKLFIDNSHRLTIWRVVAGGYRALTVTTADVTGFFEPQKVTPVLPDFIRVDWLDAEFQNSLKRRDLWESQVSRDLRDGQLHKGGRNELLEHAVLASLQYSPDWWVTNGDALLLALRALDCEGDESSDIFESKLRERLAERCRVPTRDGGWQLRSMQVPIGITLGPRTSSPDQVDGAFSSRRRIGYRMARALLQCCGSSGCLGVRNGGGTLMKAKTMGTGQKTPFRLVCRRTNSRELTGGRTTGVRSVARSLRRIINAQGPAGLGAGLWSRLGPSKGLRPSWEALRRLPLG